MLKDDNGFKHKVEDEFINSLLSSNNYYFLNPVIIMDLRIIRCRVEAYVTNIISARSMESPHG